ncbi:Na+:solute symporter [Cytophagaceae bacterium DM2B3-1]|uniref:Na+:solute symporter n=1 Tax=Xanthocytophaga flava TaxID=3048013 RepID=A0ABT7CY17_9BACT|nr:sodium:solute symporter family protein [Xanthocytophaga flavus]MDJ1498664.1 Na+:solute symporter [Xanthocytophaga flavus]
MKLQSIDILIILIYLLAVVVIGLVLRKKAKENKEEYLLGGNSLPWYMLCLSNASGMFDISGTMWMVALAFVYGLKSVWIPWLWPVFNQIFLMMYLSVWIRRSGVSTGAEWMITRFGNGKDSKLSHSVVVAFALIAAMGFLAYGFVGLGKFVEIFIPWNLVAPYVPFEVPTAYIPHFYGIILTLIAGFYAILGGMASIVWADVIQYFIMLVVSVVIAYIAMHNLSIHHLTVPDGWYSPFFGWDLDLDWSGILSEVNEKIKSDGYSPFSIFFSLMLFKGVLASLAGPTPNYDMQKVLSTKTPQEAAKMSGFVSIVLLPIRYLIIIGLTVLAILFYDQLNLRSANGIDFEKILPSAINNFVPVGLMGLLLAGLLGAFKGSFAGTLNAAQAYTVNDIYLKYIKPNATNQQISTMNYATGISFIILSIILGLFAKDVNSVLQWIVSALYGSYIAANVLKWHWWRFNGYGFFWGMVAGMIPAMIFPTIFNNTLDLYYFPLLLAISFGGCILGTLLTEPTDTETLKKFYKTVRPWGFWKPIHELVVQEDPTFEANKNFTLDIFNVVVGIIAQTALTIWPMYLVLMQWIPLIITSVVLAICAVILKKTWWDKLHTEEIKKTEQTTNKTSALI